MGRDGSGGPLILLGAAWSGERRPIPRQAARLRGGLGHADTAAPADLHQADGRGELGIPSSSTTPLGSGWATIGRQKGR